MKKHRGIARFLDGVWRDCARNRYKNNAENSQFLAHFRRPFHPGMQKLSDANEPDEEDPFADECDEGESEENEAFIEDDEGEIGEEDDSEEEEDYSDNDN